jgi:hydroxymethylglutaryl-CoA lyase/(R)-citramalyl-CoA lyase
MNIEICDVGPRDGLQNEPETLPARTRAELCTKLAQAGLRNVEAVSFVNPKRVPQMADPELVLADAEPIGGVTYSALVLNEKGFERAVAAGVREVHYAFPVTDGFALRNQNATASAGAELGERLATASKSAGITLTVTLAVAFGCPFEGRVDPSTVIAYGRRMFAAGADAVFLGDSIGVGVPTQVRALVSALGAEGRVGCHFHNTRNVGIANALAALDAGCTLFDASVGGLGGCPFAPRATGNIPTEDLVYMLHGMGLRTGIDLEALIGVSRWLGDRLGKMLPGMVSRAGTFVPVAG